MPANQGCGMVAEPISAPDRNPGSASASRPRPLRISARLVVRQDWRHGTRTTGDVSTPVVLAAALAVTALVLALVVAFVARALWRRANRRRLDAVLRELDAELTPLLDRMRVAAARVEAARARGVEAHEVDIRFPELERDELTRVPNRTGYEAELEREIAKARRTGLPLSMLLLDVRDAAAASGTDPEHHDALMRDLAELLQRLTRSTDTVFRREADELGILLPETPVDGARRFHGRVLHEIARMGAFGREGAATFAVGLVEWRPNETSESFDARAAAAVGPLAPPTAFRPPKRR
jgi:diguanylate cyclase (GGDEF)-like protein